MPPLQGASTSTPESWKTEDHGSTEVKVSLYAVGSQPGQEVSFGAFEFTFTRGASREWSEESLTFTWLMCRILHEKVEAFGAELPEISQGRS